MRTRSLVVGYFHPIFLTNSDTPHTTLGITTIHRTSIAGIGHGQLTTYHSTVLHGTADQVQS